MYLLVKQKVAINIKTQKGRYLATVPKQYSTEKCVKKKKHSKIQVSLISEKNNGYFT
jgi:hypothetical protein